MTALELPWAALDAPTSWYRLPSVKIALAVSLLIHAVAIVLLPNLRVPEPNVPPPLTVELAPKPPAPLLTVEAPPPLPPPPVVKAPPRPVPPPPVPEIKPEPKPEPPPVVERQTPPPPAQPIVAPQRPAQPEPQVTAPPRVEPPPQPQVEAPPAAPAPPPPRVQAPAPVLDSGVLREYGAVVSNAVAKKKVYPRMAMLRRWQGTAELKLQIAADGNLKALSVVHSSGFDVLDDQAMKMVKDAMPLPNLPEALRGREFAIDIPVAFRLHE